jgi:tRNA 2-thiouridine synthesizing protein E
MASVISRNKTTAELLVVGDQKLQLDRDGNLENLADWSEQVAELLARQAGVELTPGHWEILYLVREFHERRGLSPVMRILVKLVENELGPDKGNSLYLLQLFPGSPARLACRIAGLPRPSNCL